jgi:hypothetical protein
MLSHVLIIIVVNCCERAKVKESFRSLADNGESISREQLQIPPLEEEDIRYLTSEMGAKGTGYDYGAFVDSNFV